MIIIVSRNVFRKKYDYQKSSPYSPSRFRLSRFVYSPVSLDGESLSVSNGKGYPRFYRCAEILFVALSSGKFIEICINIQTELKMIVENLVGNCLPFVKLRNERETENVSRNLKIMTYKLHPYRYYFTG